MSSTLAERVERVESASRAEVWYRYAQLVRLGERASDDEVAELAGARALLAIDPSELKQHMSLVAEATLLEPIVAESEQRKEAALRAGPTSRERQAYDESLDASERLRKIRMEWPFLFWTAAGRPALPPVTNGRGPAHDRPDVVPPALFEIDPAGFFDADQLREMGMQWLGSARIPKVCGGMYYGASILAWAIDESRCAREREREALRGKIVRLKDSLFRLAPDKFYQEHVLRSEHGLPWRHGVTPQYSNDTFRGSDVIRWARAAKAENERNAALLADLEAQPA